MTGRDPGEDRRKGSLTVDEVLFEASRLDGEEREAYLVAACGDDPELRAEVESLLASIPESESFLETPAVVAAGSAELSESPDRTGERLGAWLLLERLGEGGMGEVYLAERADGAFEKRAAVKLIRSVRTDRDLERRFLVERQALAGLEHPNIARLLDGGANDEGVPFLVMEYVEGGRRIDRACDELDLSERQRLELLLEVCDAVQYAHSKLVIHRDIKPSNVLVDPQGRARLLDFGIAKLLSATRSDEPGAPVDALGDATLAGHRALTPAYASPEQLAGEPVTTASDVYSLGLLLHVVLAGGLPGKGAKRPRGDLGAILAKAVEARPRDRYSTVEQLAADIRRRLADFPVTAAPDSWHYRARKLYRRNRLGVLAAAGAGAALLAATALSLRSSVIADAARAEAEVERATAEEVSGFLSDLLAEADPVASQNRESLTVREVLDEASARIDDELANRPEVAARLSATVGAAYRNLARYDEAEAALSRSLELTRKALGEDSPETMAPLVRLAGLLSYRGRYEEAAKAYGDALELARPAGGSGEWVARAEQGLAEVRQQEGAYAEAAQLLASAIAHYEELDFGRAAALARRERGLLLHRDGRTREGIETVRQALAEMKTIFGDTHSHVAQTYNDLAWILIDAGGRDEAMTLLREALKLYESVFEPTHTKVLIARGNLARGLQLSGNSAEAQKVYRQAVEGFRRGLGPDHPYVGHAQNNLAMSHLESGQVEEAEEWFRLAEDTYRRAHGPEHVFVATAISNRARAVEQSGRLEEALAVATEAWNMRQRVLRADHPDVARSASMVGSLRCSLGRASDGLPLLRQALEIRIAELGKDHELTQETRADLEACGRDGSAPG